MKKIIAFLISSVIIVSCYDEYVVDYDFNGVFFPNPVNVRTLVVGEGMKIKVGAEIGGLLENNQERIVNFVIDNSLVTPEILSKMKGHSWAWVSGPANNVSDMQPLPSNYYTLSDPGKIIIKKGWHSGYVTLTVDSALFLADHPATLNPVYAIPFSITSADADTIIESKRSTVIGLRYEHKFFGNYTHGGVTTVKNASGTTVETISYPTFKGQPEHLITKISTIAPNAVATNGYSVKRESSPQILLTLNGTAITISSAPGASITFEPDGTSSFNGAKLLQERKLFLNYKYQIDELTYHCQDTLSFRNRIRDGVNEWQDENPENYN